MESYDLIVIGAGQGGGPLAGAFADAGRRTALIERAHVGGTCVNVGCTPTKTMVASARVAHVSRRAIAYGVRVAVTGVDMSIVRQRKRAIVESFRSGSERGLERSGVEVVRGTARFTAPQTIEVQQGDSRTSLTADTIVLDTGLITAIPPVSGLGEVPYLTSSSIMELDEVPEHLLVLGGGYVGLEFAQMFHRFGSRVTVLQRDAQLLSREDQDVAEEIATILRDDGIDVRLGVEAREGRHANGEVEPLNLAAAGVEVDARGFVRVNARLETTSPGVFALGDVTGGPAFTHVSYDDFRILRENLLEGGQASTEGRILPYTVFIDPQLGRVGLTEREAAASGRRIRVARLPMDKVARARETDETLGFMKAVVDADSGLILGASVLGIDGGEIATLFQLAMMGGLPYTRLRDGMFSHPTVGESLNNLFMALNRES